MNDTQARVARCFSSVFPSVPQDQISAASPESVPTWDSLAHIRLLSAVAEEFGLEFDMEDYEELQSVPLIVAYLEKKKSHG